MTLQRQDAAVLRVRQARDLVVDVGSFINWSRFDSLFRGVVSRQRQQSSPFPGPFSISSLSFLPATPLQRNLIFKTFPSSHPCPCDPALGIYTAYIQTHIHTSQHPPRVPVIWRELKTFSSPPFAPFPVICILELVITEIFFGGI